MDAKTKEEEQLLQDASTLLMFANVAAKQQQEQRRHSPPVPIMNKQAVSQIISPPEPKVNYSVKNVSTAASIAGIMNASAEDDYHQQPFTQTTTQIQVPIPSRDESRSHLSSQIVKDIDIEKDSVDHQNIHLPHISSTAAPALSPDVNEKSHRDLHSPIGVQTPNIISSDNKQSNIKATKPNTPISVAESSNKTLPLKGSFIPSLKQPNSISPLETQPQPTLYNHLSPGPADVTLSRGINLETGERNSNNAVIAAAALAAAADIPLPLKRSDVITESRIDKSLLEKKILNPIQDLATEVDDDDNDKTEDEAIRPQTMEGDFEPLKKEQVNQLDEQEIHLSSYQVDPDSGIIGCLCEIDDDDGFTIQCDVCYRWQHCLCMGFKTNDEVPEDEYKCYLCDKNKRGKFNKDECKSNTLKRLGIEGSDQTESAISNTSDTEDNSLKRKNSGDIKNDKRRRLDKSSSTQSLSTLKVTENVSTIIEKLPNKENELLDDGVSAENYQTVYYKLLKNDYKNEYIRDLFKQLGHEFFDNRKEGNEIEVMGLKEFKSLKFCNIVLPNQLKYLQEHKEFKKNTQANKMFNIQVKSYADSFKQKFNGIVKLGLFISSGKASKQEVIISKGTPIIEYLGEIDLFEKYVKDQINQYEIWGTTKPKVLRQGLDLNGRKLDIVIDSRFVGNESRFIRNSCPSTSNCTIKTIFIPELNSFKFLVVASRDIRLNDVVLEEELRLPWKWDQNHPIHKFYDQDNIKFDMLSNDERALLISNIDKILHFIECGCSSTSSNSSCAVFKIKKATSYLLRSTRKVSLISNVNLAKSKDELIAPKKFKHFVSWNERLAERDKVIQMNLSVMTNEKEIESTEEYNLTENLQNNKSDKSLLFKLPYKKHILTQIKKEQIEMGFKNVEYFPLEGDLPIPIIPQLSSKIEEALNKKLEIQNMVHEDSKVISTDPIKITPDISKEKEILEVNSKRVNESSTNTASVNIPPPPVKKKLSFADYKKKMK